MKKIIFLMAVFIFIVSTGFCSNETFVIKDLNLELVKCPAGSFMMGRAEEEGGYVDDSEKLHFVTITKPFYIGKYEVTQSQYESIMKKNPSHFKDINNPVETVSWEDAKLFCDKLNFKYLNILPEGYKFALPTESQWEYACRAGTHTRFNNNASIDEIAWNSFNSNKTTHIVGQKKPNAWGIYDMHGNVREWCRDWFDFYPNEDIKDPTGPSSGSIRVSRGGSWKDMDIFCDSAFRHHSCFDDDFTNYTGFRVALVPVE